MIWIYFWLLGIIFEIAPLIHADYSENISKKSVEKNLIRHLMDQYSNYGVPGRPLRNSSQFVKVSYGIALIQILGLDEDTQVLKTNCWIRMKWIDHLMEWNEAQYRNITQIRVFKDQIWTPDIQLFNMADTRLKVQREARIVVYSSGLILWVPQALFKSMCSVEISYFPFDVQICKMDFGSYTYDITQLDVDWWVVDGDFPETPMPYIDFKDYIKSNEWITDGEKEVKIHHTNRTRQIKSRKLLKKRSVYENGKYITKQYPVLQYRIRIRRKPQFYIFILIIPCILLSFLVIIVFWLPPESPAKLMLGMNIFVAFFVLLLLLKSSIPTAVKNFPLIGTFFCLNMIMITLSTFFVTIVINFYIRGDRKGPIPLWIRRLIIDGLGRFLYVSQFINLRSRDNELLGGHKNGQEQSDSKQEPNLTNPILPSNNVTAMQLKQNSTYFPNNTSYNNNNNNNNTNTINNNYHQNPCQHQQENQQHFSQHCYANNQSCQCYTCQQQKPHQNGQCCPQCCSSNHSNALYHHQPSQYGGMNGYNCNQTVTDPFCRNNHCINDDMSRASNIPEPLQEFPQEPDLDEDLTNSFLASQNFSSFFGTSSIERNVSEIRVFLRKYVSKQKEVQRRIQMTMEWRTLALVLDRLFCICYIAIIGIAVIIAIPKSEDLMKREEE